MLVTFLVQSLSPARLGLGWPTIEWHFGPRAAYAQTGIAVGRSLSAVGTADVQNNQLTITYTVFNLQAIEADAVSLVTTLQPNVSFASASPLPSQNGQELTWSLGNVPGFGSVSAQLTVGLGSPIPLQLDGGAQASATVGAVAVNASAGPAELQTGAIDPSLLASTPDADTSDPFIQAQAAVLQNDPDQIFAFVRDQIGYESYKGSLRGARGTLWSKAGNALDQASLLIALLRASGIPSRYAQGTLSDSLAQQLILSLFPAPSRAAGFLNDGVEVSDPANDPKLLAETREHSWTQFDTGGGFQDADPAVPGAQVGQSFAVAQDTFSEVPDNQRHKVTIRLKRELTNTLTGLFGGPSQDVAIVLNETLNTAEVVGKPLSIGHFVSNSAVGAVFSAVTNVYSPYIAINDSGFGSNQDVLVRGTDYQEVLTNFPFASQVLTGVFLEVDVTGPDGPTETHKRTLADRIGFAVRQSGGSPNVAIDPSGLPILTNFDVFTLHVLPGLQNTAATAHLVADLVQDADELSAQPADGSTAPQAAALLTGLVTNVTRGQGATFLRNSDEQTTKTADAFLVRAYFDRPRLILSSAQFDIQEDSQTTSLLLAEDLRRDTIRAVPFPGQAASASRAFQATRGIIESVLERDALSRLAIPETPAVERVNAVSIVEAALAQQVELTVLTESSLADLDALNISADAKARITQALSQGRAVIVPIHGVPLDGVTTIAWYEINVDTGEAIGVTEDGGHQSLVNFDTILLIGFVASAAILLLAFGQMSYTFLGNCLACLIGTAHLFNNAEPSPETIKACKAAPIRQCDARQNPTPFPTPLIAPLTVSGGAGAGVGFGLLNDGVFVSAAEQALGTGLLPDASPLRGQALFSPEPSGAFAGLTGTDVATSVVPDSQRKVEFNGAQLDTAFLVGIKNLGTTTDTFDITFSSVPAGFEVKTSLPSVQIPPDEIAEIGLYLLPTSGLPPPGTPAAFTVDVTSRSNPVVFTSAMVNFSVPEIDGVALSSNPPAADTAPGSPVAVQLTAESVGNVPENVTFNLSLPANLSANSALNPLALSVGESVDQTLTLTPSANTPLHSVLTAQVAANFGVAQVETVLVPVQVTVPGADAIADAAVAAGQLGNAALSNRLNDLSIALNNLVQDPNNPVFKSQALAALTSLISQLDNDPVLNAFADAFTAAFNALTAATTPAEIQAAIDMLANALANFSTAAADLAAHRFELSLLPNTQPAQPQVPASFEVALQNTGTESTTYDFSVSGLPNNVDGMFTQSSVTLGPGDSTTNVFLDVTDNSTTMLAPFTFEVTVTPEGAAEIARSVPGSLTARNEFVSVVSITPNPAFTNAGGMVDVSAKVLNAVNQERQAQASFTLKDPNGMTVFASPALPVQLTVLTSLMTIDLGNIDTTGFIDGNFLITVTLTDTMGNPIPGATGTGTLLIGSPLTASISIAPDTLPPGDGVVTNTLQLDTQASFTNPFTLIGQTAAAGANSGVPHPDPNTALVYVCSTSGIQLFDVTDPTQPQFLKTVGSAANVCRIQGDQLVTLRGGNTTQVSVYSLTDPQNPVLLGSTPELHYNFARDLLVSGTHAYVTTLQFIFLLANNDIVAQNGDVLSIDISDPSMPQLVDILLNDNGTNNDGVGVIGGIDQSGGNLNMWQMVQPDAQTLLVASTTSTGGDTSGTGVVRVIDISDPTNLSEVRTLSIPGAVQLIGLALQGSQVLVTASSGGWKDFFNNDTLGLNGQIVLATLDITDPRDPQLTATRTLNRASRGVNGVVALRDRKYAFSSLGSALAGETPRLFLVDAIQPANMIVSGINVPANIGFPLSAKDNLLFTTSTSGLLIYDIGKSIGIPITAQVHVPKNTDVAVVSNSFNIPPTQIITDTTSDTLVWNLIFSSGNTTQSFTWQSSVNNLQPGEARKVTLGTTVDFGFEGTPGQITLPPTSVASEQILSLDPATRTVAPGMPASYMVTVKNPTSNAVTYDLSVQGVPPAWVELQSTVMAGAMGQTVVPLTLTSGLFDAAGEKDFTVTASAPAGAIGAVQGALILQGSPILPVAEPQAHGVVVSLTPPQATAGRGTAAIFTLRVTNTGSATDTFALDATVPAAFQAAFQQTPVTVPPGAGNFVDVPLTVTPPAGTTPHDFTVMGAATSTTQAGIASSASATLTVVQNGVSVSISPTSGPPGTPFQLMVTNTGAAGDTFDLALSGPAAVVSTLAASSVQLDPAQSQSVDITVAPISFAVPGSLVLVGTATSQASSAVQAAATAQVTIAAVQGLATQFDPSSVTLPAPGPATFLLDVQNTGNEEDAYEAQITSMTGPVTASLVGLDGQPTQTVPVFRLPGLSTGAILLNTTLTANGAGSVTVTVRSLLTPSVMSDAIALLEEAPPTPTPAATPTATPTRGAPPAPVPPVSGDPLVLLVALLYLSGLLRLRRRRVKLGRSCGARCPGR